MINLQQMVANSLFFTPHAVVDDPLAARQSLRRFGGISPKQPPAPCALSSYVIAQAHETLFLVHDGKN
ncbi:hypothetical protein [Cognatishimia sp. SS12]|uniref:hypothetical protein n=1 Tax=Cognatishimia sp. SS12 TaxID=2979465 RepID=UPI002330B599|nr:hypothetical protein [Cognatishimia sp. SS12]